MPRELVPGVTVLGNLAIDIINGAPPSPGGCASFAGVALQAAGGVGRIVAMGAERDHSLFDGLQERFGPLVQILPSAVTSSFRLDYDDTDHRHMGVEAIGPVWSPADVEAADPATTWVHLAPLLRTDFPAETLARSWSAATASPMTVRGWCGRTAWGRSSRTATSRPTC